MSETFTESEVRAMLREECADRGGQKQFAERAGVSEQYICDILAGRRSPTGPVAEALGMKRIFVWVAIDTVREHE
jgi:transcriptional regulator with XRE-family HTH domain